MFVKLALLILVFSVVGIEFWNPTQSKLNIALHLPFTVVS